MGQYFAMPIDNVFLKICINVHEELYAKISKIVRDMGQNAKMRFFFTHPLIIRIIICCRSKKKKKCAWSLVYTSPDKCNLTRIRIFKCYQCHQFNNQLPTCILNDITNKTLCIDFKK